MPERRYDPDEKFKLDMEPEEAIRKFLDGETADGESESDSDGAQDESESESEEEAGS